MEKICEFVVVVVLVLFSAWDEPWKERERDRWKRFGPFCVDSLEKQDVIRSLCSNAAHMRTPVVRAGAVPSTYTRKYCSISSVLLFSLSLSHSLLFFSVRGVFLSAIFLNFCTSERRLQVCVMSLSVSTNYSVHTHTFGFISLELHSGYIAYVNWPNVHLHFHLLHVSKMYCSLSWINIQIHRAVTVWNA